ncbi:HTH domain-containing protein, partial [Enterococcus faecium]|nr:HTH domain-containing protein [Enterococcus faecium]
MQTFLTKVSQKKIKMIHLLLETERWCSIEELQNELKVSSKSILNYLTDLEELFQKYPDKVILKNENNRRFSMEKQENFPIYIIYLHFYRKSYNYHLIEFMYQHPEKNLEDYADAQYT